MATSATQKAIDYLRTLPGDDVRQIMWRFSDRFDLQMLAAVGARGGSRPRRPAGRRRRSEHTRVDARAKPNC